jgi:hypothetical protein
LVSKDELYNEDKYLYRHKDWARESIGQEAGNRERPLNQNEENWFEDEHEEL